MFRYAKGFLDIGEYSFSKLYLNFEMFAFAAAGFFIPIFMSHPQIAVGIIVNAFLISSSTKLKGWSILPIVITPSLGALSRGLLFGPYTVFLLYMIPFIWVGNYLLTYCFRKFKIEKKMNYWLTLVIGTTVKSVFLFAAAYILFSLGAIPAVFLTAFGIMQAVTAFSGGILAFGYEKALRRK